MSITLPMPRARFLFFLMALLCTAAVGVALVSQHRYDMQPCPWCVLQRLVFVLIALLSLVGAVHPAGFGRFVCAPGVGTLCVAGMGCALWQHFVAANDASCMFTAADRLLAWLQLDGLLPEIFQPRASCAEAKVQLLGLPYEFWSLALFAVVLMMAAIAWRGRDFSRR